MSFAITDWNLNPNRDWYLKLIDAGTEIDIKLYTTEGDATADTNLVAEGVADYGTASESILTMTDDGSPIITVFNSALVYHVQVQGQNGDATKTYHIKPFVDLAGINNSIYRSKALIVKRITHEINKHTHSEIKRNINVANHNPNLAIGDILRTQSAKRSLDALNIVKEIIIQGSTDSLIDSTEVVEYVDFTLG